MKKSELGPTSLKLLNFNNHAKIRKINKEQNNLRILRVICQRPFFTGSGIHLINLINQSKDAKLEQFIVFGQPSDYAYPLKGVIEQEKSSWVNFRGEKTTICFLQF